MVGLFWGWWMSSLLWVMVVLLFTLLESYCYVGFRRGPSKSRGGAGWIGKVVFHQGEFLPCLVICAEVMTGKEKNRLCTPREARRLHELKVAAAVWNPINTMPTRPLSHQPWLVYPRTP